MLHALDALNGVAAKIGSGIRQRAAIASVLACAVIVFLVSGGFAVAAGYLALAREMPAHLAALGTAAVLALIGGVLLIIATNRRRRVTALTSRSLHGMLSHEAEDLTDFVVRETVARIQRKPSSAVLTAVALGVVVGLMRRNPP
jgi:hypothetical protein